MAGEECAAGDENQEGQRGWGGVRCGRVEMRWRGGPGWIKQAVWAW